ncbi:MAG: response regulator transcription factor [Gaiellales bacterium]
MRQVDQTIRVVLLDDAPLMRQVLITTLASDPRIQVTGVATDAGTLLEALALRPCDLVLMDLQLHGEDGLLLIERIRLLHHELRIAVLTAIERTPMVLAALRAGANGYLTKRQQPAELLEAICIIAGGDMVVSPQVASSLVGRQAMRGGQLPESTLKADELDVLRLVARGDTDLQIARQLYISPRTVQNQLARIRSKAGVQRRTELVRWASENAIV